MGKRFVGLDTDDITIDMKKEKKGMKRILKYSLSFVLIGALMLTNGTLYFAKEKIDTKKVNNGRYSFEFEEQIG